MPKLTASNELPAITLGMPEDHIVSAIVPGSGKRSMVLAHQLAAECCMVFADAERDRPGSTYHDPKIEVGKHGVCLAVRAICGTHSEALALVQRLEGVVPKYARDDAGFATHRVIVMPWAQSRRK